MRPGAGVPLLVDWFQPPMRGRKLDESKKHLRALLFQPPMRGRKIGTRGFVASRMLWKGVGNMCGNISIMIRPVAWQDTPCGKQGGRPERPRWNPFPGDAYESGTSGTN